MVVAFLLSPYGTCLLAGVCKGGPCVDTLRSVEVKIEEELEKTILCELEDGSPVCQYGL